MVTLLFTDLVASTEAHVVLDHEDADAALATRLTRSRPNASLSFPSRPDEGSSRRRRRRKSTVVGRRRRRLGPHALLREA